MSLKQSNFIDKLKRENANLLSIISNNAAFMPHLIDLSFVVMEYQELLLAFRGDKLSQSYQEAESRVARLITILEAFSGFESQANLHMMQGKLALHENKKLIGVCDILAAKIEELTGKSCKEIMNNLTIEL